MQRTDYTSSFSDREFPMKFFLICTLAVLLCGETALANDLSDHIASASAAYDWSGLYLGTGFGFRSADTTANVTAARNTSSPPGLVDQFVGSGCYVGFPCVTGRQFNTSAFRFNPYAGYNWQISSRWIAGIEADAGLGSQTTKAPGYFPATPFLAGASSNSFSVKTAWDASVRGRVGYLVQPGLMIYGTGGPAWIRVESTSNCSTADDGDCISSPRFQGLTPGTITNATTKLGFTVGGGLEAMLSPNWIVRGEYRYSDFGTFSSTDVRTIATEVQTTDYDVRVKTHTAVVGLAYRFGDPSKRSDAALASYAEAPASTSWTGAYVGGGIGVRTTQTHAALDSATITLPGGLPVDALQNCLCIPGSDMNGTSFRVSPYVGYNWQFAPRWVAGIDADLGFSDQSTTIYGNPDPSSSIFGTSFGRNDSYGIATKWDSSLRLRLGYVINPSLMIYGAAGPAWMEIEKTSHCDTATQYLPTAPGFGAFEVGSCAGNTRKPADITQSAVRTGFTLGVGGEARLSDHWVARAEYRYADYGTAHFTDSRSCAGSVSLSGSFGLLTSNCLETDTTEQAIRIKTNTISFGVAYKFD